MKYSTQLKIERLVEVDPYNKTRLAMYDLMRAVRWVHRCRVSLQGSKHKLTELAEWAGSIK